MRLQPLARAKVVALGETGARWQAGLPDLLDALETAWGVRVERRSRPGGSAGLVAHAVAADGTPLVVKVAVPGEDLTGEARVLAAAGGRGYVGLHAADLGRRALLLERLGRSLEQTPRPVEEALDLLVAALRRAWAAVPVDAVAVPRPGEDKGSLLHRAVAAWDRDLDHGAPAGVVDRALACAERRAAAHDPAACVVVHGDPHPGNLLRRPPGGDGWALVDPDGLLADPAYDLGVVLRDWSSRLLGDDAVPVLEAWCARAAAASGVDEQAVWDWAYAERVSTGLYVLSLGAERVARPFLRSAQVLAGL